jgi:hypothetical protein
VEAHIGNGAILLRPTSFQTAANPLTKQLKENGH